MNDDEPLGSEPFGERNGSAKKHAEIIPTESRATVETLDYTGDAGLLETLVGVRESGNRVGNATMNRERVSQYTPRSGPITRVR